MTETQTAAPAKLQRLVDRARDNGVKVEVHDAETFKAVNTYTIYSATFTDKFGDRLMVWLTIGDNSRGGRLSGMFMRSYSAQTQRKLTARDITSRLNIMVDTRRLDLAHTAAEKQAAEQTPVDPSALEAAIWDKAYLAAVWKFPEHRRNAPAVRRIARNRANEELAAMLPNPVRCENLDHGSRVHTVRDDCKYPHNADVPTGPGPIIGHPYTAHD
jgi:hypothetical protein